MAAEPLLDVAADRALEPRPAGTYFRLLALQSLAFFFTFAAFNAAQALAGSIPAPPGLAPIQFMAIYVTFAFLCIPAPKLLSRIGPKACMILGMSPYAALVASFLAPQVCTDDTAGGACWGLTRSTLAACVSLLVWCDCRTQKALWNNLDAAWCRMAESIQSPLMRVSLKLTDALSNMRLKYVSPPLFVFPVVPSHTRFSYLSLSHARISACLAP